MPLVISANSTSCSKNLRDPGPQAFGFLTSSRTVYIYISEFQPEVPFPRPSDTAVPPDLQAHRIRVASRPGNKPDKPSIRHSSWGPGRSSRRPVGVGDLHRMPVETVRVNFFARVSWTCAICKLTTVTVLQTMAGKAAVLFLLLRGRENLHVGGDCCPRNRPSGDIAMKVWLLRRVLVWSPTFHLNSRCPPLTPTSHEQTRRMWHLKRSATEDMYFAAEIDTALPRRTLCRSRGSARSECLGLQTTSCMLESNMRMPERYATFSLWYEGAWQK